MKVDVHATRDNIRLLTFTSSVRNTLEDNTYRATAKGKDLSLRA